MKKSLLLVIAIITLSSCSPTLYNAGEMDLVSRKNYDKNKEYVFLKSYHIVNAKDKKQYKEIKRANFKTIDKAIDYRVRSVAGGEYIENAKIYVLDDGGTLYYYVEGDVWGVKSDVNYLGLKIGDKVKWRNNTGVIVNIKDAKTCTVQNDENQAYAVVEFAKLIKI